MHNLSDQDREIRLELGREELDLALEMFSDRRYERLDARSGRLKLGPYGFRWFRIQQPLND